MPDELARPSLGMLIKTLRARNGWTLKETSVRSGISVSTLSKVEHGRLSLTYDKLLQLSQRLDIRMSELFAENDAPPATSFNGRRSIGDLGRAVRINTASYDNSFLCAELRRKRMTPILTKVRAKSADEFGNLVRHPGEEFIFVLTGRIVVHTEFYIPLPLEEGESLYIDSNMGHAYVVGDDCDEAVIIAVCSSAQDDPMNFSRKLYGEGRSETTIS